MSKRIGMKVFQTLFKTVQLLAPGLATRWAIQLWFLPFRNRLPQSRLRSLEGAETRKIPVIGLRSENGPIPYYVRYSWGQGPTVLLVHGWGGRGAQMTGFVAPLLAAGFQVIAYDAVAHGDAPRRKTDVMEMSRVIEDIAAETGGFHAIIAHSLGGMAGMLALRAGVPAERLVTINTPASVDYMLAQFAQITKASPRTMAGVREHIERKLENTVEELSPERLAASLDVPGLVLHDKHDREVNHGQGAVLSRQWPRSEFVSTEGLGHNRILLDPSTIDRVTAFVARGFHRRAGPAAQPAA